MKGLGPRTTRRWQSVSTSGRGVGGLDGGEKLRRVAALFARLHEEVTAAGGATAAPAGSANKTADEATTSSPASPARPVSLAEQDVIRFMRVLSCALFRR